MADFWLLIYFIGICNSKPTYGYDVFKTSDEAIIRYEQVLEEYNLKSKNLIKMIEIEHRLYRIKEEKKIRPIGHKRKYEIVPVLSYR